MPVLLDLFCGRLGWSRAFAKRGWKCVGVDLTEPPEIPDNCEFINEDILSLELGSSSLRYRGSHEVICSYFDAVVGSSPCENFSLFQMRNFHPNPPYPNEGIELFNHARNLCESSGLPYVLENVARAQDFVGRAVNHSGSFYLWGNAVPPLLPKGLSKGMKMDRKWCQELGGHGSIKRNMQTAAFATIPPELANCVAEYFERVMETRVQCTA